MAEAMQGVMSLAPERGGMGGASKSYLTPEDEATLTQLRNSVSPQDFNKEMFNAAEEADPQAVAQLRSMLQGMQLPQELIDLMKEMVDVLLQEPAKYAENRAELIKEGVPEDLLPSEFDPTYLMALDMALDQVSQPVLQGFAKGGLVRNPISAGIASLGRGGDRMLAHITPREARMLMRAGGSGTINPITGLPEFGIKKFFKAIGGAFVGAGKAIKGAVRGLGNAIKKFASSTVGRIVTSVALGFLLGPAAASMLGITSSVGVAAIGGFIGSAGSTLLAGGSVGDALKAGAMGGITAGAFSGVTGGMQAFKAGSYAGPTTVSGSWQQFTESLSGKPAVDATKGIGAVDDAAAAGKAAGVVDEAAAAGKAAGAVDEAAAAGKAATADEIATSSSYTGPARSPSTIPSGQGTNAYDLYDYDPIATEIQKTYLAGGKPVGTVPSVASPATNLSSYTGPTTPQPVQLSGTGPAAPAPAVAPTGGPNYLTDSLDNFAGGVNAPIPAPPKNYLLESPSTMGGPNMTPVTAPAGGAAAPSQGVMDLVKQREFVEAGKAAGTKLGNLYDEYLSPSGIQKAGQADAVKAYKETLAQTGDEVLARAAYDKALPGPFATYAPLAATVGGAAYLGGAFDVEEPPKPDIPVSGAELYRRDPYLITPDVRTISASTGTPYRYATGGVASLARGSSAFPRKTGPIDGPGTGTSDSIPAMLSDGEFVFTAKAVRAMGGGSRRKGAKRMYALMKALEKRV